jgi:hypothetical protein
MLSPTVRMVTQDKGIGHEIALALALARRQTAVSWRSLRRIGGGCAGRLLTSWRSAARPKRDTDSVGILPRNRTGPENRDFPAPSFSAT